MLNLPAAFASLAQSVGAAMGAPFYDGQIVDQGEAVRDEAGSIVTPGTPVLRACRVQIDSATEAMRAADGFAEGDVRFILLAASFTGSLDTDATVKIAAGDRAGVWLVSSLERDPAGIGYVGKGRKA